jgi:hypothetical protein
VLRPYVDEFDQKIQSRRMGVHVASNKCYTKQTHSYRLGKVMAACTDNDFASWLQTYHSLL